MRRIALHFALALAALGLGGLPRLSLADVVINPQAGVQGTNRSNEPADITDKARLGYAFGGNLRIGKMAYMAPGAYYQRTALRRTERDDVTLTSITDDVDVHSVYFPLKFGVGLMSPSAGARSFGLRIFAGPAATVITSVKANAFGLTKDDFKQTTWGGEMGVGLDFSTITLDASYEKGFTNEIHGSDAKRNVLRGVFGVKL